MQNGDWLFSTIRINPTTGEIYCDDKTVERWIKQRFNELKAVYRLLDERRADLARCPKFPGGERCALPVGHEGGCKWANGD